MERSICSYPRQKKIKEIFLLRIEIIILYTKGIPARIYIITSTCVCSLVDEIGFLRERGSR